MPTPSAIVPARVIRKRVPDSIQVKVALRQLADFGASPSMIKRSERRIWDYLDRLKIGLALYLGDPLADLQLQHRPALANRPLNKAGTDHVPPANSPDHLVWMLKESHRLETYVRGEHGSRSDFSQRRYLKRVARNRDLKRSKGKPIKSRGFTKGVKRRWPKRSFNTKRR